MPVPPPLTGIATDSLPQFASTPAAPTPCPTLTRDDSIWTTGGPSASPRFVHAALLTSRAFSAAAPQPVSDWLSALGLQHLSAAFESHGVTSDMLLSLSASELRRDLGVTRLRDRRLLMDGIAYLRQIHGGDRPPVPEDGRILTHLMMERAVLAWAGLSLAAQTLAVASLREQAEDGEVRRADRGAAVAAMTWAVVVIGAAAYRHVRVGRFVEAPGARLVHGESISALFVICVCAAVTIAAYVVARFRAEDLAVVAMLAL